MSNLNGFDYVKAVVSAVRDVVKDTLKERKEQKQAESPDVIILEEETETATPLREHTYDPFSYDEYVDPVREFVSPREYDELPQDRREQIALNNYLFRRKRQDKTNEEIGSDYERFVAYLYTAQGYQVFLNGIRYGKNDSGIDLIAKKGADTLIIQCKYWGKGKEIHENCVTQLYGSCHAYELEYQRKGEYITPVLVTNITLDYEAGKKAKLLGVSCKERLFMRDYPRVKCCTFRGRNGNSIKLYFLPFDEAYDDVDIESERTSYAYSVQEAVYRGFHRDSDNGRRP